MLGTGGTGAEGVEGGSGEEEEDKDEAAAVACRVVVRARVLGKRGLRSRCQLWTGRYSGRACFTTAEVSIGMRMLYNISLGIYLQVQHSTELGKARTE